MKRDKRVSDPPLNVHFLPSLTRSWTDILELLIDLLYLVLKRRGSLIDLKGQSNEILDLSIKNTGTARSQAKI